MPARYQVPLPIPPVLSPARSDATTDYYEITQQIASLEILPGLRTTAWTFNGTFPGPTLVSRSGRRTVVRHTNTLAHPTVVHLHGGHTPHDSDGYPLDLILPATQATNSMPGMTKGSLGGVTTSGHRTYTYPLNQRAATLWYHDHRMGFTGPDVWQGLAGFHLVHDDEESALPLPTQARDVPLMITDRSFKPDGSFHYPWVDRTLITPGVTAPYLDGVLGDVILVNGAPWPVMRADRARYRFRILNASNARRYELALDPQPPGGGALVQIGSDGGLLDRPIAHDCVQLAPAERFDVIIDFSRCRPGSQVRLVNRLDSGLTGEVMAFQISSAASSDDSMIPGLLSTIANLDPGQAVATRTFLFQGASDGWSINGQLYQPGRSLARPTLGTTEIWRFITDVHHPIHLHLNHFQVLSRDGRTPGPYDSGWKDTIDLQPAQAAEIAVRFTDYDGRFMLHCHNLEHEDMGMMADFTTTH